MAAEGSIVHTQGRKDVLCHILAERLSGEFLNDLAGPIDACAIVPALAWGELQRRIPRLQGPG